MNRLQKIKKPIIEYDDKRYVFSIRSLILFAIGAPVSAYLIYLFFDSESQFWLHEIVVKQTVYFLNLFFDMDASAVYNPTGKYHWDFIIPGKSNISFETFCTGIQAICVFAGVIIFTPHSQDERTKSDIIWRKTKSLIISSVIFYVVNIIRMLIQIQLYHIGYAWEDIHFSISAASSFIAAIIVLLMHKWIPEFIISIIYIGTLISEPVKHSRKERVRETVRETSKVELGVMRKILKLDKKTFSKDIVSWSEEYGYNIEGNYVIIPEDKVTNFINLLMQDRPFKKEKLPKE